MPQQQAQVISIPPAKGFASKEERKGSREDKNKHILDEADCSEGDSSPSRGVS